MSKLIIKEVAVTTVKKEVVGINLELSIEEAVTLCNLFGGIGGSITNSVRMYTDSVRKKIMAVGVDTSELGSSHDLFYTTIGITSKDNSLNTVDRWSDQIKEKLLK